VKRKDLLDFARRDHELVESWKVAYWADFGRVQGPTALMAIADGLRRHVMAIRPDWPTEADRRADLEAHARVSGALHRVQLKSCR
jgi:hypothetical protein